REREKERPPKLSRTPGTAGRTPSHIEVRVIGLRGVRLAQALEGTKPTGIIMVGFAGALDPSLRVGDVVIDDCPPAWIPQMAHRRGKICCADSIVGTPSARQALFNKTGALAVDMECTIARNAAARLGVPFALVRAISDDANETLDPAVLGMVDSDGRARLTAIGVTLLRRPSLIGYLKKLAAASKLACAQLGTAVAEMADEWQRR
ncbi:MAG TPA: hypothetical protein VFC78_15060, partial [Tepidisphaeraceae bacterium]|nr:hypothetical protein [Tepidisphaeraceae bacterium]